MHSLSQYCDVHGRLPERTVWRILMDIGKVPTTISLQYVHVHVLNMCIGVIVIMYMYMYTSILVLA